jgi:hypothetical protein
MLLGRSVWTRDARGWRRESFGDGDGMPQHPAVARLAEFISEGPPGKISVVFEPEGVAHQTVETPMVGRTVFASLAKIQSEHPVVVSECLGWGIEIPEPAQSGTYTTLVHYELIPGLVHLRDACSRSGSRLVAAWPAYTAAVACLRSRTPASKAKFVLIMAHDYVAVATSGGGKRAFRGWAGPMSDKDWKALSTLMGGFEARTSPSMAEVVLKRGSIAAISDGEPNLLCPIWGEIRASGRLETVVNMETLAASAAKIPVRHPANLAESFPTPINLNAHLAGVGSVAISVALALGVSAFHQQSSIRGEGAMIRAREQALESHLATLAKNLDEMSRLRKEVPNGVGSMLLGRHNALLGLAASVPDVLTLTSLSMGRDGSFEITAIVVGAGFEPENLRTSLERCGFKPASQNGWAYDAASGTIAVRGIYGAPST